MFKFKILSEEKYLDLIEQEQISRKYAIELEEIITNLQETIIKLNAEIHKLKTELKKGRTKWS